jgi:hypothetical protein
MIINESNKLNKDGLRWHQLVEEDITKLVKELRKENVPYEDISYLLLLGVSDAMMTVSLDEYCDKK